MALKNCMLCFLLPFLLLPGAALGQEKLDGGSEQRVHDLASQLNHAWRRGARASEAKRLRQSLASLSELRAEELERLLASPKMSPLEARLLQIAAVRQKHPGRFAELESYTPWKSSHRENVWGAPRPADAHLRPEYRLAWELLFLETMGGRHYAATAMEAMARIGDRRSLFLVEWALARLLSRDDKSVKMPKPLVWRIIQELARAKEGLAEGALEALFRVHEGVDDKTRRRLIVMQCTYFSAERLAAERRRAASRPDYAAFVAEVDRLKRAYALARRVGRIRHALLLNWRPTTRDSRRFDLRKATRELAEVPRAQLEALLPVMATFKLDVRLRVRIVEIALARQVHAERFSEVETYLAKMNVKLPADPRPQKAQAVVPDEEHLTGEHRLAWEEAFLMCSGHDVAGEAAVAALARIGDRRSSFVLEWGLSDILNWGPRVPPLTARFFAALAQHIRGDLAQETPRMLYRMHEKIYPKSRRLLLIKLCAAFPSKPIEFELAKANPGSPYRKFLAHVARAIVEK